MGEVYCTDWVSSLGDQRMWVEQKSDNVRLTKKNCNCKKSVGFPGLNLGENPENILKNCDWTTLSNETCDIIRRGSLTESRRKQKN